MKVSVALCTLNGEQFLPELLNSLKEQCHAPFELIVGDDGSCDKTVSICQDFADSVSFPVHVTQNERRLGYADNFLATARRCSGDIVAFCDQDDIWHPNKLEFVENAFLDTPNCVLTCHYATVVDRSGRRVGRRFPRKKLEPRYSPPTLPLAHFPGFSLSVRTWLLSVADADARPDATHAQFGRFSHDAWLWLVAGCVGDVRVLADELVSFRQHDNVFGDLHVNWREKFRRIVAADATTYERARAEAARDAEYISRLAEEWNTTGDVRWADHAARRADSYRCLADQAAGRAQVYAARTRRGSLARWLAMYRLRRAWRSDVNRSALSPWKDFAAALLRPSTMQR